MPRYRRRYYRRRRNRILRKSNIYMNKSARAQAYQIAALNRKISYVYKVTKPETSIAQYTGGGITFTQGSSPGDWVGIMPWTYAQAGIPPGNAIVPPLGQLFLSTLPGPTQSPSNNFCRLRQCHIYGFLRYTSTTTQPVLVRLVFAQMKVPASSAIGASQVFTSGSANNAFYPFGSTLGPLQEGVSRNLKVLKTYLIKLDSQHPAVKFRCTLNKLMNFSRDTNSNESSNTSALNYGKGSICMYYQFYADGIQGTAAATTVTLDCLGKLAFTDN